MESQDDDDPQIDTSSDQIQKCNICNEKFCDGYCGDCEAYMCQTCFDRHLNIKSCKYHVLGEDNEQQTVIKKARAEPCKIHANLVIEFFCVDHKKVGCAKCMLFEHSTCRREDINVAAKRFQDNGENARLSEKIKKIETTHSDCMKRVRQLTQAVAATNDKTVNDIEAFKASISSSIYETVGVALEKAERLRLENETRIERFSDDLTKIRNSVGLFKDNLKSTEELENLFIAALDMEPKLAEIQKNLSTLQTEDVTTEYRFHPHKSVLDMINNSRLLGEVLKESEKLGSSDVGKRREGSDGYYGDTQRPSLSIAAQSAQSLGQDNQTEMQHNSRQMSDGSRSTGDAPIIPHMCRTPGVRRAQSLHKVSEGPRQIRPASSSTRPQFRGRTPHPDTDVRGWQVPPYEFMGPRGPFQRYISTAIQPQRPPLSKQAELDDHWHHKHPPPQHSVTRSSNKGEDDDSYWHHRHPPQQHSVTRSSNKVEDDSYWRQKRQERNPEFSSAIESARQKRAEEYEEMEKERKKAAQEKLKALEERISKRKEDNKELKLSKDIEDTLNELIVQQNCDNKTVIKWIKGNVNEATTKTTDFIRALVTAVCVSAIKGDKGKEKLESKRVSIRNDLLQTYFNHRVELELQALYAIQAVVTKLGHPIGFMREMFDTLYDEDIISEPSFFEWEHSYDETEGKSACLKQTARFFTWLREPECDGT